MHPDLEAMRQDIERCHSRGVAMLESYSPDQLTWRPSTGGWSVAECLDHLNTTNEAYALSIARVLEATPRGTKSPADGFRCSWLERQMLKSMEPPVKKLKFKAPKVFLRDGQVSSGELRRTWDASHARMIELIEQADGLDGRKVKVVSPVTRLLKSSLPFVFRLMAAHDRRHLWQAEQVVAAYGTRARG